MLIASVMLNAVVLCILVLMWRKNSEISDSAKEIGTKQETLDNSLQANKADTEARFQLVLDTLNTIQRNTETKFQSLLELNAIIKATAEIKFQQLLGSISLAQNSLSNENTHWVLEKEDGIRKFFKPGNIVKIEDNAAKTETFYDYVNDKVFCTVNVDGKIKSEIQFNSFGSPLQSKVYNSEGNIIQEFKYNELGQVETHIVN